MPILVKHIESQWTEGMNWENFGAGDGKWTMDHIKPCAAFNLADESQQLVCFNYLNLRPMWWIENLAKGSDWNGRRWKHADHACPPAPAA